jgi:hypothetical protein
MARELSPTLEAQQKYGLVSWPYLIAKISRKWGGVIRYDFTNLYSGAESDYFHTAAMPSDRSLIRLRVTLAADARKLYYQRVTSPNEASDFSAWTYLSIYNILAVASCAYEAKVSQFYINTSKEIKHRESTDSGASWGSWSIIDYSPTTTINGMDAAYKPNGDITLVFNDADTLYKKQRLSGSWASKTSNSNALANKTGVSIYFYEDWNIVVTCGAAAAVSSVSTCIYGDGVRQTANTWSAWETIIDRGTTEPYIYRAPCVRRSDNTRLFFVENFTEATVQNHIWYSHMPPAATFDDVAWLEPVPMEPESTYGLAFCYDGTHSWLTNANSVHRALATEDELDITSKLLIVDMKQQPDIQRGQVIVTIDNTNGYYNTFARLGEELTIGIGYKTSAGNEYSLASSFWISSFRLESPPWYVLRAILPKGIIGTLVIEAKDAWDFLARYKTRRTHTWAADDKSVQELLQYFIARSGLDFEVLSASDAATNFKPAFTVARSTSYRTIIKNLLKMIPDQLIFREAKVILRNPTTTESADWTYDNHLGTALLLYRGRYGTSAWDPNRAEVWTDSTMTQVGEYPQITKIRDRLSRVTEPTYPDLTRAGERALSELRKAEILTGEDSWLDAPTNCGLEPWDKLKITDSIGGVTNIYRRVIRIVTHWDKKAWKYHQVLVLGAD